MPYNKLVTVTVSWLQDLAMGPLAPESRPPLGVREVQLNSTLGFGSRLGSSIGLRGWKGEKEGKNRFLWVHGTDKHGQARVQRGKDKARLSNMV